MSLSGGSSLSPDLLRSVRRSSHNTPSHAFTPMLKMGTRFMIFRVLDAETRPHPVWGELLVALATEPEDTATQSQTTTKPARNSGCSLERAPTNKS